MYPWRALAKFDSSSLYSGAIGEQRLVWPLEESKMEIGCKELLRSRQETGLGRVKRDCSNTQSWETLIERCEQGISYYIDSVKFQVDRSLVLNSCYRLITLLSIQYNLHCFVRSLPSTRPYYTLPLV